jgi:hypothetical protein
MALWFLRGLGKGVVTTRYPAKPEPTASLLPTPPAFVVAYLDRQVAELLSERCPSLALSLEPGELVFDVGACTGCATCSRLAPRAVVPSGMFELAATRREDLLKRIPIRERT